jgi:hypothetical protein
MAWVKTFISHLSTIYEELKLYRIDTIRMAYMTPQIAILEKYLNDKFDTNLITITDGILLGPWIFLEYDINEFYLDLEDSYVWNVEDEAAFVVNVPILLEEYIPEIIAIVHKYKLPGKSFIIYKFND